MRQRIREWITPAAVNLNAIIYNPDILNSLQLFQHVSPESIESLLERCQYRHLTQDEILLNPEQRDPFVYAIVSGCLEVFLEGRNRPPLTTLTPGDCTGEMSMIEGREPCALVIAAEPSDLLVIDHDTLAELINTSHGVARNLLMILSSRVRHDNNIIADGLNSIQRFEHSATRDALTDLHNRHWLQDMFRREIQRCKNRGVNACLLMIDVDRFKDFNDMAGHMAGDHALTKLADVFRANFRASDLIARFGGDEFAVFLPEIDLQETTDIAERIRGFFSGDEANPDATDLILPITLSIGIANMQPNDSLDSLIKKADKALYQAKQEGRNRCVTYKP